MATDLEKDPQAAWSLADEERRPPSARASSGDARARRRMEGQFFTPPGLAMIAAAAAIPRGGGTVVDPMAGTGNMLQAARDYLDWRGSDARVVGIEIDRALARRAKGPGIELKVGDAFSTVGFRGLMTDAFDAVIGNPPYVRYQRAAGMLTHAAPKLSRALAKRRPDASTSERARLAVRVCLVSHLCDEPTGSVVLIEQALARLEGDTADLAPVDRTWVEMVGRYSGLADLAVPTWLLSYLLAKPGGRIAFVAPDAPLTREYGRFLRYFQLRFLEPLLVIEPASRSWFPDALVPASLQLFAVRDRASIEQPLADRGAGGQLRIVRLAPGQDLLDERSQRDLLGGANRRGPALAQAVVERIQTGEGPFEVETVSHQVLVEQLLRGESTAQRAKRRSVDVRALEGHACSLEVSPSHNPQLVDLGISVHQGLRTGCNPFFYARRSSRHTVRLDALFDQRTLRVPAGCFRPAVRRQIELDRSQVDAAALLDLMFVAEGMVAARDLERLEARYPSSWVREWKRVGLRRLSSAVSEWIGEAARKRAGPRGTPIPKLTAVAPNVRLPGRPRASASGERAPALPRFWYTLPPLRPRHLAPLFMERVVDHRPRPRLNDRQTPAIIDANFSTFVFGKDAPAPSALFALLLSDHVARELEREATPLGGGALKVEAAHLRSLSLPELDAGAWRRLAKLGDRIVAAGSDACPDSLRREVDRVLHHGDRERATSTAREADARRERRRRRSRRNT
jgi:hypothetical protein